MTANLEDTTKRLINVASAVSSESSFLYDCKVNSYDYRCKLDTAAFNTFLFLSTAKKMKLSITPNEDQATLGDGYVVSTVGTEIISTARTEKGRVKVGKE